jgi:hypothetical protein
MVYKKKKKYWKSNKNIEKPLNADSVNENRHRKLLCRLKTTRERLQLRYKQKERHTGKGCREESPIDAHIGEGKG